jgi:hypothetical protein
LKKCIFSSACLVIAQICGVNKTFFRSSNSCLGKFGSSSQTSAKNLEFLFSFKNFINSISSIIQPLEVFTKITSFFSKLISFCHKKFFVAGRSGI